MKKIAIILNDHTDTGASWATDRTHLILTAAKISAIKAGQATCTTDSYIISGDYESAPIDEYGVTELSAGVYSEMSIWLLVADMRSGSEWARLTGTDPAYALVLDDFLSAARNSDCSLEEVCLEIIDLVPALRLEWLE